MSATEKLQVEVSPAASMAEEDLATAPGIIPALTTKRQYRHMSLLGPLAVFAAFIGFWYAAPYLFFSDRKFLVPPPHDVLYVAFIENATLGQLWDLLQLVVSDIVPFLTIDVEPEGSVLIDNLVALWLTTKVALTGLFFAIVLGTLGAMLMSQARWIEQSFYPYLIALQAVPILALVPLIGSFFGFGFTARVIVCIIISFFPIVANTLFGLLSAERGYHELLSLHGAGRLIRLRKLMIPAALPAAFTGLRIAAGLSVIGAIVGDFFFRRGDPGIGSLLDVYFARIRQEELFGATILSSLLGIAVFVFFGWLGRLVTGAWHEERAGT